MKQFLYFWLIIACMPGWIYYNNFCYTMADYKVLRNQDSTYGGFLKANQYCQSLNSQANLVMPKTQDVLDFIQNNLNTTSSFWVYFLFFLLKIYPINNLKFRLV